MSPNLLGRWADVLLKAFDAPVVGATLVRFVRCEDAPDEFELGLLPIDGHPVEMLVGFRAPADWLALGVITGGWAAPLDGSRPSAHPEARRVTQVFLIDRDGVTASVLRYPDGSIQRLPGPAEGAVPDALRAALGLRTSG